MLTFPVTLFSGSNATRTATYNAIIANAQNNAFTSAALGTAEGSSVVVCIVQAINTGVNSSISTMNIAGVNVTAAAQASGFLNTSNFSFCGVFYAVTSSTSGTINVNFNNGMLRTRISVYRLNNLLSTTHTTGNQASTNGATSLNFSITPPVGGILIAALCAYDGGAGTPAITNITNDNAGNMVTNFGKYVDASNQNVGGGAVSLTGSWTNTTSGAMAAGAWN